MLKKYHVQKGDDVVVNAGKWKGEKAKIAAVITKNDRVVVEFAELSEAKRAQIGTRTVKKSRRSQNGEGMIERSVSVHVSNVALTEEAKQAKVEKKAARREAKKAGKAKSGVDANA